MLENTYKTKLCKRLHERFAGCLTLHLNPNEVQGIPDLLFLYGTFWATLEVKVSKDARHRPNQDYWVQRMNQMSFSAFIYPENEEEVLNEMEQTLRSYRTRDS